MNNTTLKLGIYRHYKGHLYEVLGLSRHSDTLEILVLYQALYESKEFGSNALWVRPLQDFTEMVTVEDSLVPRFKFVTQSSLPSLEKH